MVYSSKNGWVVLVNEDDKVTGVMEKLMAHQLGKLHRAFSVFVFNSRGELLLQQRAADKYHSPGLWTNTCCSHPTECETVYMAARRRLMEEMNMDCELTHKFSFIYKADVDKGLTEYEYDHVFMGNTDDTPKPCPNEVSAWKYMKLEEVQQDLIIHPEKYTAWFKICFDKYFNQIFL